MSANERGQYSAAASALGYLYQVRYALLESLRRLRRTEQFVVSIEALDDVVFETEGEAPEILQTKHRLNRAANLTDGSPDLWKTLRIWCEALANNQIPEGTLFFLVTTGQAADGHAACYLKPDKARNPSKAMERLNSTAGSSRNQANAQAYQAYRALSDKQRLRLLESVFILEAAPDIEGLDGELKEVLYFAVKSRFFDSFLQRLEGWWYHRTVEHLLDAQGVPILSDELESQTASLREQFKQESLPIDDDILRASVDASGYQDHVFVHQLRLIEIGNPRIIHAIRNYFRAFEQRSRWVREDLLLVGELGRYEERLVEEWDILYQQMRDRLGRRASEAAKKHKAQTLYEWVETATHPQIRPGVSEAFVSRGSYQILSEAQRVGWHVEFRDRLRQLLELPEAAP